MINEEQLKRLRSLEDFRCFLDMLHAQRESVIASLASSGPEQLKTRAGTITALQEILDAAGYASLIERKKED